jgi:RNA polymerase sigma-70 factor (ECF subfamily)
MGGLTEVSDGKLLKLLRRGSEEAFKALYRRYQGSIYRFAFEMSGSPSVAEEVTQEVFTALIEGNHRFDSSRGSLAAYLLGMTRHVVLRSIARDRPHVSVEEATGEGKCLSPPSAEDPLAALVRRESIRSVQEAILSLPRHYREAVVLCDLNEMTYDEAAAVLECSVGTVRSRLHRGRVLLLQKLRGEESLEGASKASEPRRCLA